MRKARFQIIAKLDSAGPKISGTVEIDRDNGLVDVRPKGRRRVYTKHLADVADWVVSQVIKRELADRKKAKEKKP